MSFKLKFVFILACASVIHSLAWAVPSELKIVDHNGLTRLVAPIETIVQIKVELEVLRNGKWSKDVSDQQLQLVNLDGLLADIPQDNHAEGLVLFSEVQAGHWKLKGSQQLPFRIVKILVN